MRPFLLVTWIYGAIAVCRTLASAKPSVVTSVAGMTSLVGLEANLIQHLSRILDVSACRKIRPAWTQRTRRSLDCLGTRHASFAANSWQVLHNPVAAFRLVSRLVLDWDYVTTLQTTDTNLTTDEQLLYDNVISIRTTISRWRLWPEVADIQGAALALVRIGATYSLYPHTSGELANKANGMFQKLRLQDFQQMERRFANDEENDTDASYGYRYQRGNSRHDPNHLPEALSEIGKDSVDVRETHVVPLLENSISVCECQSCQHVYGALGVSDLMYITDVTVRFRLPREAQKWMTLTAASLTSLCRRMRQNPPLGDIGKAVETPPGYPGINVQQLVHDVQMLRNRVNGMKDQQVGNPGTNNDKVMFDYYRLCLGPPPASPQSSTPLTCRWYPARRYLRYKMEELHRNPDVWRFYDVISDTEMSAVKLLATAKLQPSSTATAVPEASWNLDAVDRVSQTAWLDDSTAVVHELSQRVSDITGLATRLLSKDTQAEPLQVVNYGLGGLYTPHQDSLGQSRREVPPEGQERSSFLRHAGDRLATWMFYMSDVSLGGATVFPVLNLHVKPVKGSGLLWYNLKRSGVADGRMVHAGCPVVLGIKWVANKWIRENAQWKRYPCSLDDTD